jgi:hypothetical protein
MEYRSVARREMRYVENVIDSEISVIEMFILTINEFS